MLILNLIGNSWLPTRPLYVCVLYYGRSVVGLPQVRYILNGHNVLIQKTLSLRNQSMFGKKLVEQGKLGIGFFVIASLQCLGFFFAVRLGAVD